MQTPDDSDDEFLKTHPTIRKILEIGENEPHKILEVVAQAVQDKSLSLEEAHMLQEAIKRRIEDLR